MLALVPLVMRKAFGPQAGVAAVVINGLAITGIVLLLVFAPVAIFPVMVVLGPLTVAQYLYWMRKFAAEQTFRGIKRRQKIKIPAWYTKCVETH